MSQRGRSGFLSYLLLLSRLLQFEHRAEEVAPPSGPRGSQARRGEGERGRPGTGGPRGDGGLPPPPTPGPSPSPTRAAGAVSSAGLRPPCSACTARRATCRRCSWLCCEWARPRRKRAGPRRRGRAAGGAEPRRAKLQVHGRGRVARGGALGGRGPERGCAVSWRGAGFLPVPAPRPLP